MSNPFKLRFNLQQHTPIVHFQHSQKGATLRATELKPKLDRFLIKYVFKEDFDVFKKFLIGYSSSEEKKKGREEYKKKYDGKWAFDYEVKIHLKTQDVEKYYFESSISQNRLQGVIRDVRNRLGNNEIIIIKKSPYFANNDKRNNNEWEKVNLGLFSNDEIYLDIFSFHTELLEKIQLELPLFFVLENFGTRQSKGFGCFNIKGLSNNSFEKILKERVPYFLKKNLSNNKVENVFREIDLTYKNLKSNGASKESAIRDFYQDKEPSVYWEKGWITESIVRNNDFEEDIDIKYVRALLGLAQLHDYQQLNVKVNIKHTRGEIDRFKSPMTFKLHNDCLYLLADDSTLTEIQGEAFAFYIGEKKMANIPDKQKLEVPNDFSLVEFLKNKLENQNGWKYVK